MDLNLVSKLQIVTMHKSIRYLLYMKFGLLFNFFWITTFCIVLKHVAFSCKPISSVLNDLEPGPTSTFK